MKVGTDGVLLGAWCGLRDTDRYALDIGTGTGLIALMLAQRGEPNPLLVDAVEIDAASADEATENAAASPWADRIRIVNRPLQEFVSDRNAPLAARTQATPDAKDTPVAAVPDVVTAAMPDTVPTDRQGNARLYDLIVSNPPFFSGSLLPPDAARSAARHTVSLSYGELICSAARLLADNGRFCVIIPYEHSADFLAASREYGFSAERVTNVIPKPGAQPKRSLIQLLKGRCLSAAQVDELLIELGERHEYSPEYKALTSDFYLKF